MSIQRTAQSALHALAELYNAIDISNQGSNTMSMNDSENIVHALCDLSQLIDHINQTGMCGQTPVKTATLDSNRFNRRKMTNFLPSHPNSYDDHMIMDSATIGPPPQPGQPYGECIVYHPIRIITTGADGPTVLHENDFARKKEPFRKDHEHRFSHHGPKKKNQRRMSRSHSRRSRSNSRISRSGSRGSRMSRRSRKSSHSRASRSQGHNSRSSRRSRSRSSRRSSRKSKSGYRRSSSRGRKSRSSQRGRRRSRSSQRRSRSRRRSSHKRRSADHQYRAHPIPSQPMSTATATAPSAPSYLSNQVGIVPMANQLSAQQPFIRPQSSSTPMANANNGSPLPPQTFTPTSALLPPPAISSMYQSHPSSQLFAQQHPPPSILHGTNTTVHRPMTNTLNDLSSSYQQVPVPTTNTGSTKPSEEQSSSLLSSTNPAQTIPTQNSLLSSSVTPLQATNSIFTSRSDNCPECRAITRLLQWAPLKCYDAAGIRRGVFLAGPKSEQLLKALYSSMKDTSLSLDDIEDCICDNESNK